MGDLYRSVAVRRKIAESAERRAKLYGDRARKAEAHGIAAIRFRDWRGAIDQAACVDLSGDRLRVRRFCHHRSYGGFVTMAVQAEACDENRRNCGHITGATFYPTYDDARQAAAHAPPGWRLKDEPYAGVWRSPAGLRGLKRRSRKRR